MSAAVEDYPRTLGEFEARFATEEACRAFLVQARWPDGFRCPRCGAATAWPVRAVLWQCAGCGRQTSVTAGTIFSRYPHAADDVVSRDVVHHQLQDRHECPGPAAGVGLGELSNRLGVAAQAAPGDGQAGARSAVGTRGGRRELSVGGLGGARGRSTAKKALIVVAAEEVGHGIGRIRMRRIPDASADSLQGFIADAIAPGSRVHTDGWHGYDRVKANGYRHHVTFLRGEHELASELLPRVHRVISLLKRWLLGTHQGAVSAAHLDYYLDEFTFRFNRRTSRHRGKLFFRLVQQAVAVEAVPYARIIQHGRRR